MDPSYKDRHGNLTSMAHLKALAPRPWYPALLSSLLAIPLAASAALPTTCTDVIAFIIRIANSLSAIIFALAILILVYAGFLFLTGGGNEETRKKAQTFLIYTLVGLAVVLFAFVLPDIAESVLDATRGTCTF